MNQSQREPEKLWVATTPMQMMADVLSGKHRHIAFVVGSGVSLGMPSACLGVKAVISLVLDGVYQLSSNTAAAGKEGRSLLAGLRDPRKNGLSQYYNRVHELPFEQFLGCLSATSEKTAVEVVRLICGSNDPNGNHESIVKVARALLEKEVTDVVSIITTNYDLCLDRQLGLVFGKKNIKRYEYSALPSYEVSLGGKKVVRYVKVHGCIEAGKLVFTFAQMLDLITSKEWQDKLTQWLTDSHQRHPSLTLFVGYGFWDPDLRELMYGLFHGSRLYRNEKSDFTEKLPASATAQLQREFFEKLHIDGSYLGLLRSELVRSDGHPTAIENCLTFFLKHLTGEALSVPLSVPTDDCPRLTRAFSDWDESCVAHFLSRLLWACNLPDSRTRILDQLYREPRGPRQVDLAHLYLRTFGTTNKWRDGTVAAKELRRRRLSRNVNVVAWGIESFMRTLVEDANILVRAVRGGWCLLRGGLLLPSASAQARAIFREYSSHYKVKAIQSARQFSKRVGLAQVLNPILKRVAHWQSKTMNRQLGQLAAARDFEVYGDTVALLTELTILSGKARCALESAQRSRVFKTVIGRASNAIQAERLLGWALLAQATTEGKHAAIQAFARAFSLSTHLPEEPSIARKMGANLLRLGSFSYGEGSTTAIARKHGSEDIRDACRMLTSAATPDAESDDLEHAWQIIAEHVLYIFKPRDMELLAELRGFSDWRRYPMYLPLCEPPQNDP